MGLLGILFGIIIVSAMLNPSTKQELSPSTSNVQNNTASRSTPKPPKSADELRKERIATGFSLWDGSHRKLEERIKKAMNDPDSYQHVETRYADKGDYLIVSTEYRGKNAFGGVVKNAVVAKCSLDGVCPERSSPLPHKCSSRVIGGSDHDFQFLLPNKPVRQRAKDVCR